MNRLVWISISVAILLLAGIFAKFQPAWTFTLTIALTKGFVAVGLALLMRAGLVSFGQGLYYCLGGYTVGMLGHLFGIRDFFILVPAAALITGISAVLLGFLLAKYRDIFFAMLSLALSMILYGLLVKTPELGGTDGFNVASVTFFGVSIDPALKGLIVFVITCALVILAVAGLSKYLATPLGKLGTAVKDNEIRVEYLGASAQHVIHVNYVLAAILAGLGGALSSLIVGHVDPEMAFWTTSGEFVFIAVLGGVMSPIAPFSGAIIYEVIRTIAFQYAPNTWQLVLGATMLLLIVFIPNGLWDLVTKRIRGQKGALT